ncbi:hypothetical protein [Niabella ginsengisoli]|uniref:DUF4911 domain-containing protein n=1 Tax=Niabella ginsengisoli TaxID=522298 RepID=A0ABS9SI62_9BACT|nr:hypothetical protein [Niabella ginsengisoli]MCH5598015.1 hypothetical protein [Niabella ginsengisoli]
MLNTNDVLKVYDTILSTPGMNDMVKIDLRISRKNILLLSQVIEKGILLKDEKEGSLIASVPNDNLEALKTLATECLQKAGLVDLQEKLLQLKR